MSEEHYPTSLHGGDVIRLPDGRVGTITYKWLDGCGGVWGELDLSDVPETINDDWPAPEFMLRSPDAQELIDDVFTMIGFPAPKCVGTEYKMIRRRNEP